MALAPTSSSRFLTIPTPTGGGGLNGASNLAPAIKHQFQPAVDGLIILAVAGVTLDTGNKAIAGAAPSPFLQMPVIYDLAPLFGPGWTINGMAADSFHPRGPDHQQTLSFSTYLDRAVSDRADVFVEFANLNQSGGGAQNTVAVGSAYRYAELHQIDFKLGAGLSGAAPNWTFTIGYSLRFDQLFGVQE